MPERIPDTQEGMAHAPVIVVGAGLAGLTAALTLRSYGIGVLVIDKRKRISLNPRARGLNFRSMELLSPLGVADEIIALGAQDFGDFSVFAGSRVLDGNARRMLPPDAWNTDGLSHIGSSSAGQDLIEPIMLERARELGVQFATDTELIHFREVGRGIEVEVRRDGERQTVSCEYLIAADGHRSRVRDIAGIPIEGIGPIQDFVAIVFDADIPIPSRAIYYLRNEGFTGVYVKTTDAGPAVFSIESEMLEPEATLLQPERFRELVRDGLGAPHAAVDIQEVSPWRMSAFTASSFRNSRVFLTGDAAHTMPPVGGLGGQTAIQSAFDLSWKLAMVLKGWAGDDLLSTYEQERRPICVATVDNHTKSYFARIRPDRNPNPTPLENLSVAFGYSYSSSAIVGDGALEMPSFEDPRAANGRPGSRAPFVDLRRDDAPFCHAHLIGGGFTLIGGPAADWIHTARAAAAELAVPLETLQIGRELGDPEASWCRAVGVEEDGAILLRPDGMVGWRATSAGSADAGQVRRALSEVAGKSLLVDVR